MNTSSHTPLPRRIALVLGALLAALLICEFGLRAAGHYSPDGEFWAGRILLRPYRLPVRSTAASLQRYQTGVSRLVYEAALGWAPRPGYRAPDGMYSYNSRGIRGGREYAPAPSPGTLRIAVFGDSHTHGDEVRDFETWPVLLEEGLHRRGVASEVLNFGVSGYAMDQAYLRWEAAGKDFSPQVVIFGFQPENVKRNLSLLRFFYTHDASEIPFTKPRLVLRGGRPESVNLPTPPPEKLLEVIAGFENWPLGRYDYFFRPADFRPAWYFKSRLVSFAYSALHDSNKYVYAAAERRFYDPGGEPGRLALAIIRRFKESVAESGARFFVLHLPRIRHMTLLRRGEPLVYAALLARIKEVAAVIPTEEKLGAPDGPPDLTRFYIGAHHYTPAGNAFLGEFAAEYLATDNMPRASIN